MQTFTVREALEFGWRTTRAHSGLLFQIMLALFALQVAQAIVDRTLANTLMGALASLALAVVSVVMSAGFTVVALKLAEGHAAHFSGLFPWNMMVWRFFLSSLLAGLAMAGGLLLLVVPGLILTVRLSMARYAVVEGARPIDSLKKSWRTTRGHGWHLFGFLLVLLGINIVGAALLLVGLLVTVPVSALAWAHVYLKLKHKA